jgi:VWFA-related protein
MKRLALAAALLCSATVVAQREQQQSAPDLVELDVVVVDNDNHPVRGLVQTDFEIKEDGSRVEIKTFAAVTALGTMEPDDARSVVILLDDSSVPISGTAAMQTIATRILSPVGRGDDVAVVRLNTRADEAFGDLKAALFRIGEYRGGMVPFNRRDTAQTALEVVARISKQVAALERRRKSIICIGQPAVCDVAEPNNAYSLLWTSWVDALKATAEANVAVYMVDPTGLTQLTRTSGGGLVEMTGGQSFRSNDFQHSADVIWNESGHYYLLGYWPSGKVRELHSIDVKVSKDGAHARTRRRRGR